MRRILVAALVGAMAVMAVPLAGTAAAQGTGNVAAFCQARAGTEAAFASEDAQQIKAGLDALSANAPPEIAADVTLVTGQLGKGQKQAEKAFEDKKFLAAFERMDAFVVANCGFPVINVVGIDYQFQGIPATIPAGMTAFKFTNQAPKEDHEMALVRLKPGETIAAKKLLDLFDTNGKKAEKLVEFATGTEAAPGHSGVAVTNLTPGHYVVVCFHPVNGKKNGKEHWRKGMLTEFDVA